MTDVPSPSLPEEAAPPVPLGGVLVALLVLALLPLGSVRPLPQAVLHLALAAAALLAARRSDRSLERAGRARTWVVATALLPAVLLLQLVPLPGGLLALLSPARVAARPPHGWAVASLEPARTVSELATLVLVLGFGALVCVWATGRRRRSRADLAAVGLLLGLVLFGAAHVLAGARSVLGVFPVRAVRPRFFAPLVDPNHFGTLLLLGLPVAVGFAREPRYRGTFAARVAAVAAGLAAIVAVLLGSPGVWLAGAIVVGVAVLGSKRPLGFRLGTLVGLGVLAAAAVFLFTRLWDPSWAVSAVPARLSQWGNQPATFLGFPVLGSGGGTYEVAYAPFRTWPSFARVEHAHSDWIELAVETGAAGIVAFAVAAGWIGSRVARTEDRGKKWSLGLLGAAVHAAVDFPLQIPAVAMAFAGAAAVRYAVYGPTRHIAASTVRRGLLALALLQVPLAAWDAQTAVADRAVADVRALSHDPQRARRGAGLLRHLAPWRPEAKLYDAWTAQRDGREDDAAAAARAVIAAHPESAEALREAALVLDRAGERDAALAALERAATRDPNDYRTWVAYSRILREASADPLKIASAWAEAMRHWPYDRAEGGKPLEEGWAVLPVGLWWVDALSDAPTWWSIALGGLLTRKGDPETALLAYDQAAARDPDLRDWPGRARALAALGREDEAEELLRGRIAREPQDSTLARHVLADLLLASGKAADAEALYLQVAREAPTDVSAQVGAVKAAQETGGVEHARAIAERLALSGRDSPALDVERARLALADGQPARCMELLDAGVLSDPSTKEKAAALRAQCQHACSTCSGER